MAVHPCTANRLLFQEPVKQQVFPVAGQFAESEFFTGVDGVAKRAEMLLSFFGYPPAYVRMTEDTRRARACTVRER
jgi:hypothetical protein